MSDGGRINSGEYGTIDSDSTELSSNRNSQRYSQGNGASKDGISLSGTLKKGIKLAATDQVETTSLSGTLRRGIKIHSLGKGESVQNLADPSPSPRNSKKFSFRSPKKSKKASDDTISMSRSPRNGNLRMNEVVPNPSVFDDTISLIGGLLENSTTIKQEEGIRDVIGRKSLVTLKKMIKLERPQGDKADAKVLVLTPYRCQILGVKAPFKLEADLHFLEIKSMDSPSPDRLVMSTHSSRIFFMQMIGTDDADHIIGRVALSLRTIFPSVPLSRIMKASLEPLHRQKVIQQMLNQADQMEPGPCGNFSEMYRCVCDFLSCPVREEVEWDVDTIYLSQNCRELNLKDFDLADSRDIIPIVSVLNYNKWFEGLIVRNTKLNGEVLEFVLKAARNSQNMKTLVLEGVGLKGEFAQKLASSMVENKESRIENLDLSNNPLEDKGLIHLSGALPVIKHAHLTKLNVSRTGLTAKGVTGLCQSLRSSANIMGTLTHLNLSGNCLKVDESEGLYNFLATENHIVDLDLSSTDSSVEMYISALSRGCLQQLQNVDLSKNHFLGKTTVGQRYPHFLEEEYSKIRKQKDTSLPTSFQEFFQNTKSLRSINFSNIKFPNEAVKCVMDGLVSNTTKGLQVALNMSNCELKASGCQVLQTAHGTVRNLVSLDVSDNSLENELPNFFGWLQQNRSIRELKVGRNFSGIKQRNMRPVMDSIVELVQEENSVLESLSLADSKLRDFTHVLLGCLGSNTSLTELDISGNQMGDTGARVLAKSLQINSRLRVLKLDRNNLTAAGFHELAVAMEKNFTLRYMPYPVNDCMGAMKQNPERTQGALAQIQDLLLRNANTNRASNDQQFRLQKVVTSTAQQVLDKVAEKVDDVINALEIIDADSENASCVITGKKLVRDAKNSKELLSDIYGLGMEKSSGPSSQLQCKISEMASDMDKMVQQHVKSTVEAMRKNAESQCPQIYEEIKDELNESVAERQALPTNCVRDHVIQSSGTEIANRVSELNLSVATLISDKVTDSLLAALSQCNLQLTTHLAKYKDQQKFGVSSQRPPQIDEESAAEKAPDSPGVVVVTDVDSKSSEGDLLPDMRRERAQSVAKRRQRPVKTESYDENDKKDHQLGELPPIPGTKPQPPAEEEDVKKITDFGAVYDPYSNDKVKERKKQKKQEEADAANKAEAEKGLKTEVAEVEKSPKKKDKEEKKKKKAEKKKDTEKKKEEKKVPEEEEKVEEPKQEEKSAENDAEVAKENNKVVDAEDLPPPEDVVDGFVEPSQPVLELDDLPDTDSHPKLDHVTKNRVRGPNRRGRKPPTKKPEVVQESVDDFFTSDLSNTDFSATPTQAEEEKLKEKDKQDEKKTKRIPGGIPMGGMPMVTPGMLKKKTLSSTQSSDLPPPPPPDEDETPSEESAPKSPPATEEQKPAPARRPKGAMVMPGMGFGNNLFAEMKQRKLNKKTDAEDPKSPTKAKDSQNGGEFPIGPELLRKTSPRHSPNDNNNNNSAPTGNEKTSPKKLWGVALHHPKDSKATEKPEPEKKVALKPPPPSAALKPSVAAKGKPPPLPSKPKPAFLKPGHLRDAKSRPVSEFLDTSSSDSLVRNRAASWGKSKSVKETKGEH